MIMKVSYRVYFQKNPRIFAFLRTYVIEEKDLINMKRYAKK